LVVASLFVFLFHLIYFYSIDTADDTAVSSTKSTTTTDADGTIGKLAATTAKAPKAPATATNTTIMGAKRKKVGTTKGEFF